jgi:hypothetical protein
VALMMFQYPNAPSVDIPAVKNAMAILVRVISV